MWFDAAFVQDGEEWIVTTQNNKAFRKDQLPAGSDTLIIKFGPRQKNSYYIKFKDELHSNPTMAAKGILLDPADENRRVFLSLLENDKRVFKTYKRDGKDLNGGNVIDNCDWMLENLSIQKQDTLNYYDKVVKAYGIVRAMSFEDKKSVGYYFGVNPDQKSHVELTAQLIDLQTGVVVNGISPAPNEKPNIDKFLDVYLTGHDYVKTDTLLRKLIDTRTVEMVSGQGFHYNGHFIAADEQALRAYIVDNKEMAQSMERAANQIIKRLSGIDDMEAKLAQTPVSGVHKNKDVDRLREYAKSIGLANWNVLKEDKLRQRCEVAYRTIKVAEKHALHIEGMTIKQIEDLMTTNQIDYHTEGKTILGVADGALVENE